MRISEVTHLRVTDIDASRNIILIRQSKGAKDRDLYPCKSANKTKNTKPTRPTRTVILCNKHPHITPDQFDMRNFILYIKNVPHYKEKAEAQAKSANAHIAFLRTLDRNKMIK